MESSSDDGAMISGGHEAGSSDSTIEIKIETLHSRTYTLRVDKHVTVLALKEQIATVSGLPSQVVQLLYRRRALQNDQRLSAYNVEDGHSLHMVIGPSIPSWENLFNNPGTGSHGRSLQGSDVAPRPASRQRKQPLPRKRQMESRANMTNPSSQRGSQMNPNIPAEASGHISTSGSAPNQTMTRGEDSEAGSPNLEDDPDRASPPSP